MPGILLALASSASAAVVGITAYYILFVSKKPKVHAGNLKLRRFLDENVPVLREKFSPSPLYFEGRLQTILGLIYRVTKPPKFNYDRELYTLKDGGEIALDHALVETPRDGKSLLVLLFPGLTSSSQSCYVKTLVTVLNQKGVSVVVFNNRGIGGVPFKTPRTYSASNTEDAAEVIEYLRQKFPSQRMMALGTSLGGMVLSKYLITHSDEARRAFEAAMIISIAWDANSGTRNLETNFINRHLINTELARSLVNLAKKFLKSQQPPPNFNVEAVLKAKTVREFDEAVTAPQFGFPTVVDYYNSATMKGHVYEFPIPVFGLNAEDDPMCPPTDLPIDEAEVPGSNLALIVTTHGGHLGFLEGFGKKTVHFMEKVVGEIASGIRINGID